MYKKENHCKITSSAWLYQVLIFLQRYHWVSLASVNGYILSVLCYRWLPFTNMHCVIWRFNSPGLYHGPRIRNDNCYWVKAWSERKVLSNPYLYNRSYYLKSEEWMGIFHHTEEQNSVNIKHLYCMFHFLSPNLSLLFL